jgi:ATP-dependent Clp protease, protease subunit
MELQKAIDFALNRAFKNESAEEDNYLKFYNHVEKWLETHEQKFEAVADGDNLEITIFGVIGQMSWWESDDSTFSVTAKAVKKVLDANSKAKNITVLIDSPGGDVFDGIAIHSLLKRTNADVKVEVLGEASSAASIIAQCASPGKLKMHAGSMMMIHRASNIVRGNAEELRNIADILETIDSGLLDIYENRNKKNDRSTIEGKLKKETWMTAQNAVDEGFADEVLKDIPKETPKPAKAFKAVGAIKPMDNTVEETTVVNTSVTEQENADEQTAHLKDLVKEALVENLDSDLTDEEVASALAVIKTAREKRIRAKKEEYINSKPFLRARGPAAPAFGGFKH